MKCVVEYIDAGSCPETITFGNVNEKDVEVTHTGNHTIVTVKTRLWLVVPTERFVKVEVTPSK